MQNDNNHKSDLKNSIIGGTYMICGSLLILADSIGNISEIAEFAAFALFVFGFGITVYNLLLKNSKFNEIKMNLRQIHTKKRLKSAVFYNLNINGYP